MRKRKFLATLDYTVLYCEDDPADQLAILKFVFQQESLFSDVQTQVREIVSETKKFLLAKIDFLHLTLISRNSDDTPALLHHLMKLFYVLICFRLQIRPSSKKRFMDLETAKLQLKPLLKSLVYLVDTHQATLFGGIETPEIDTHETRTLIVEKMASIVDPVPWVCHALLMVGPEIVAIYSRGRIEWVLKPSDMLCLVVYNHSKPLRKRRRTPESGSGDRDDEFDSDGYTFFEPEGEGEMEYLAENEETYEPVFMYTNYHQRNGVKLYTRKFLYGDDPFFSEFSVMLITYDSDEDYLPRIRALYEQLRSELEVFLAFLNIKAHQHFTMQDFFHLCPGILHFVFIDKLRGKVVAPRIIGLGDGITKDFIKEKLWEMHDVFHNYKKLNYDRAIVYTKQVIYSYRAWMVCVTKGSGGGRGGVDLESGRGLVMKEMRPNCVNFAKEHYELYAMYLPFVSIAGIEKFNRNLIARLCDGVQFDDS